MRIVANELWLISWEDITSSTETWSSAEDIKQWYLDAAEGLVDQVGYIIFEDKNNILLSDSYIDSLELYGNVHKIPKSVIRSRVKLTREVQVRWKSSRWYLYKY